MKITPGQKATVAGEEVLFTFEEETLSCTGPTVMYITFKREYLHNLHVSPEEVVITLAREVK